MIEIFWICPTGSFYIGIDLISTSHMEVLLSVWTIIDGFPYLSCWFRIDIYMQLFHLPACTLSFFRFSQHACKYYGQLHCLLELIMHHVTQAYDRFLVIDHFDKHYDFKFTSVSDLIRTYCHPFHRFVLALLFGTTELSVFKMHILLFILILCMLTETSPTCL